ncbi:MAG: hypothetical protein LAQ30_05300 [Acidobacteriia bacterium]|nr:hypothetical protein [Terriglobia bacterium]
MAKFKPSRAKSSRPVAPKAGLPCVILILIGMVLVVLFMFWVLKNSAG